ncbi:bifunctional dTDP-4-dehydrorhamnose 3,5-epimerase family protein/NAD(P)-dependent oxidoreductase [uncultured Serinicoccus sp.]|uniref:bifunctional dTDP-4-dehydrorhamnose 3,5-epimerase family protein/NAD(P)-dependent oxidoreductase n=1 Tax=uncultured Serinicoccus sp. TaxID=735514 RepID=UPI0026050AB0|nr:bifunctional dTDP-4-dehydrorhamnose 3,5-epimerase family protein/NAD(P)-dependent oxidoreductase [uncultured Serinicoccus sp.]
MRRPAVRRTAIPGLLAVDLEVHGDSRGWFKENWQRAKMVEAGLPDFGPVQHSVAYNGSRGVTRGVHAEPWDKFVSIVHGRAFGAWVDLRVGPTFGAVHTEELDERTAVFVPRGVGNSYQVLEDDTVYSYLVNDHWSPDAAYTMLNLADEATAIPWPIPLVDAQRSEKDLAHPPLAQVRPVPGPRTLVIGQNGQVGRALREFFPNADYVGREELDLSDPAAVSRFDFTPYDVVINAAADTAVDEAETSEGRRRAWAVNAEAVRRLARAASEERFLLVHFSTDYVFDGRGGSGPSGAYVEDDPIAPLGAYGQSKAAGELAVQHVRHHYLVRTSWVVGEGKNFVATMRGLAEKGVSPSVIDDQVGRLTPAREIARATRHLLDTRAPFGTYHVTGAGPAQSWCDIARAVFVESGRAAEDVSPVTTDDYGGGRDVTAPRPALSVLDTSKVESVGFVPDVVDVRRL